MWAAGERSRLWAVGSQLFQKHALHLPGCCSAASGSEFRLGACPEFWPPLRCWLATTASSCHRTPLFCLWNRFLFAMLIAPCCCSWGYPACDLESIYQKAVHLMCCWQRQGLDISFAISFDIQASWSSSSVQAFWPSCAHRGALGTCCWFPAETTAMNAARSNPLLF